MIFIWKQSGTSHGKSACDGIGGTVKRPATKVSLKRPAHNQILTPLEMFSYCESDADHWDQVFLYVIHHR